MIKPWMHSGASETWAPAGATFYKDWLLFVGLRGAALYKVDLKNKVIKKYFSGVFGRLRTVVVGPDGYLYLATSNTDGRGNPKEGDDKIIRINPKMIEE
jgi:glucose/arabinose dehydrogenase